MNSNYTLPISIVIVGIVIAGAVFLVSKGPHTPGPQNGVVQSIHPVTSNDHISGNPNAAVKIVEYADLECPYCKQFQSTMDQVMQYYGPTGKVAWVYRNFPLGSIHSKAPQEHQAAECAADQGGNTAFFKYIDRLYAITPSENGLDLAQLPIVAKDVGLNVGTFSQCVAQNKFISKVQQDYTTAIHEGLQGTPHIVIMTSAGAALSLDGAQPYASMRAAIDQVLQNIGETIGTTSAATSGIPSGALPAQGAPTPTKPGTVQNF